MPSSRRAVKNDPGRKGFVVVSPGPRVGVERMTQRRRARVRTAAGQQLSTEWRSARRNSQTRRSDRNHCTVSSDHDVLSIPSGLSKDTVWIRAGGMLCDMAGYVGRLRRRTGDQVTVSMPISAASWKREEGHPMCGTVLSTSAGKRALWGNM
ncbi:hypothetical protein LX36DRAFT_23998 [Colletotrichum falcatum]|nr:hypothetical protein LX36DRAFT_23998 [Colletotrichum falcatum]